MADLTPSNRNFFDEDLFGGLFPSFLKNQSFDVDVKENQQDYEVKANLPGFHKEDLHVDYDNNILTIKATAQEHIEEHEGNYLRKERSLRSVSRQFMLKGVKEEDVEATFKDGVLTITLPKTTGQDEKERKIEIK